MAGVWETRVLTEAVRLVSGICRQTVDHFVQPVGGDHFGEYQEKEAVAYSDNIPTNTTLVII